MRMNIVFDARALVMTLTGHYDRKIRRPGAPLPPRRARVERPADRFEMLVAIRRPAEACGRYLEISTTSRFRSLRRICIERAGFTAVEQHGYGWTPLSRRWPTMFSDVFLVATK